MRYHYISADNHLDSRWLPKNLWQERVEKKYKDEAPKVVETEKGSVWHWEGRPRGEAADGSQNGILRQRFYGDFGIDIPEGALPPSDPKYLLKHLDMADIYAGVFFGDTRKWDIKDPELKLEVYRAYNDFVMQEINAVSPDRLLVLPILPTALPEACPAELRRLVKAGARAVEFSVYDVGKPIYETVWDPLFAAVEEAGVPLCCHIGDRSGTPYPPNVRGSSLAHFSVVPFNIAPAIAQFVFSGALERFPKMQVSFAECRIGWLPFLINWMDRQVRERPADPSAPLSMLPSEYVRRNITFTFEEDMIGGHLMPYDWAHLRHSAMWGADYPHEQGTWPRPAKVLDVMFEGVDPAIKQEVLFGRAARLFNIEGGRG